MWRVIIKEIVFAAVQGLLAFIYARYKAIKSKEKKENIDKRIDELEKKVVKDEKELIDELEHIDSNL